jgi:hypothetical protein
LGHRSTPLRLGERLQIERRRLFEMPALDGQIRLSYLACSGSAAAIVPATAVLAQNLANTGDFSAAAR